MNIRIGITFLFFSAKLCAQFPDAPSFKIHDWKTEQSFDLAQDTVRAVSKWLCETPISWQYDIRSSANVYVLNWMTNHPIRKWELETKCFGPLNDHLELLYAFLQANLYFTLVYEKSSQLSRDVFVMQVLSKKILWSDQFKGQRDWQDLTKSVEKGREKKYLTQCSSKTKQPIG